MEIGYDQPIYLSTDGATNWNGRLWGDGGLAVEEITEQTARISLANADLSSGAMTLLHGVRGRRVVIRALYGYPPYAAEGAVDSTASGAPRVVYLGSVRGYTFTLLHPALTSTRQNLLALRDGVVSGGMPGWSGTPSGGTAEQPAQLVLSKGVERLKVVLTYGTSGGAAGNVTNVAWYYSVNSGAGYDLFDSITYTYDASGNYAGHASA